MTTSTSFPQAPLTHSFRAEPLRNGQVGDVLVRWPRNRAKPTFILIETPEQLQAARDESVNDGPGKSRFAIVKATGDLPTFFLVAWANIPRNLEAGAERAYNSGLFFERVEALTTSFLELPAPAPTPEQVENLALIVQTMDNARKLLENRKRLVSISEEILNATASEFLSGKIDKKEAALYITRSITSDGVGLGDTPEQLAAGPTARKVAPGRP